MAKWWLRFQISFHGGEGREILKRLCKMDTPPERAQTTNSDCVEAYFLVEAEKQIDAVRCQNEIDEKLRAALKGVEVRLYFDNPKLAK